MNWIPESWETTIIPEMISKDGVFSDGDWIESKDQNPNGNVRLIQLADIGNGKYLDKSSRFLTLEKAKELNCTFIQKGDVLVARLAEPLGRACIFPGDSKISVTAVDVCIIRFGENRINHEWLISVLNSPKIRKTVENLSSGTTRKRISRRNLATIQIPLPPLNEQKRIVAKIEALQTKSTAVKEELEAIKPLLDQFRQSVLASAFRGNLTKDWREQNRDIPWEHTTLKSVIKDRPRNGYSPKAVDYPTQVKSFSLSATTSGIFKPEYFKYLDKEIKQDSHLWLKPGDILIQRSNTLEYVGTSAIYTGEYGDFIYPDTVMKVQVNEDKTNNKFIHYSLSNKKTRQYFKNNATGTAGNMPKINQKTVMNIPIALPPLEEQKEIVHRIKSLFKLADNIEQQYQQAEADLETLNQSILAKAFRGELVPQDPNDEPASILLERIKEEREKAKPKKSKSKRQDKQLDIPGI